MKLRPGEVKDLVKITQLVRGKAGSRTGLLTSYLFYYTAAQKSPKERKKETGSCDGVSRH